MKQYKRILNAFLAVEKKVRSSSQIYPPTLPITRAEKFQRIIRRCLYLNFDLLWVRISLWLTLSLCHRTFRRQHSPNTPYFFSHLVLVTSVTHFLQQKRHCFFLFFATKLYMCTEAGRLFLDRLMSTRSALHTSVFNMVSYEIARARPLFIYKFLWLTCKRPCPKVSLSSPAKKKKKIMRVGTYQLAFVVKMETLSYWRLTTICCKLDYQWRHNRRLFCSPHYKNKYIPISVCLFSYIPR